MRTLTNLLALGVLIGLGLGIPLAIYLALDAVLYGLKVILLILGGTGLAALGYIAILKWRQQDEHRRRPVDGSFPLQQHKIKGGGVLVVDPNKNISGVYVFHPRVGYREICANNMDLQAIYAGQIQTTRHIGAMTPGDDAQIRTGMISNARAGIANSATGKWLDGAFRPQPKPVPALAASRTVAEPVAPPPPRLSLTDALGQSTGHRWIVGQSDTGQIAAFEPAVHAHAGIVGSTGTGKTRSVGYALTLAAIRSGWHVLILDPDGGADWSPFRTHTEWNETDRATFPGQIENIHRFYERRASLDNPRPVLVVIEEYGDLIRQLRTASRSTADQVDAQLDSILQRGRKRRVHVALIDQYPEHWSQPVIGGTKFRAVFQLGPNQGAKMEEYKAAQLGNVGRFLVRGVEYNSFDASTQAAAILRQLPAPASPKRIINGTATHIPASSPVSSPASSFAGSEQFAQEVAPPSPASTEPEASAPGPTDIQAQAIAYIQANPTASQTDLRLALGLSKAYANELWHAHNPAGKNYQLPTDSMDLTNDNDRQQFQQLLAAGAVTFSEPKDK